MMKEAKVTVGLTRPARSSGGDRYECAMMGAPKGIFVIYIPQTISRVNGQPIQNIEVVFRREVPSDD